ncbi:DUF1295 domain-containing protein [Arthrobacter sp. YD4]|uniref:DUF1295 domain-containing protein n=1 Tax=Arthrobacter sp. YD4 TaxID=3058043 RepID=UPI0025B3C26A|nr:DUF1295 domain-containing protein [Arthrobacter sp. YD4]MDN3937562.1 DUF1295 domain-containing protein [Arthrobacter sp. YD4]
MKESERKALAAIPVVVLLGAGLAWAGSQNGAAAGGIPVFTLAVAAAFIIQWLAFIPAYLRQTERFYDLTGSLTYIAVTVMLMLLTPGIDARGFLLAALVLVWAARLGSFLFRRISKAGKDDRFDEIKPSFVRFLSTWTMQGIWVAFTAAAAWVAMTSANRVGLDWFALIGVLIWVAGFGIEATADRQKGKFSADPANKGKFIHTGLWAKSRHPNYFGEILLWVGVAIIALPVLQGWQWVALISPVFVALLITKVSGVPHLEKKADRKWGGQADYEEYKKNTPVLIPKL